MMAARRIDQLGGDAHAVAGTADAAFEDVAHAEFARHLGDIDCWARAMRVALTGGAIAFALTEAIGVAAALWPAAWLGLFSNDPGMLATGAKYLRIVGPTFGFFGLGLALYFASQGAGRLVWPLLAGLVRLVIAVGAGWVVLRLTGSLGSVFAALSLGLVAYGVILSAAIRSGAWFRSQGRATQQAIGA